MIKSPKHYSITWVDAESWGSWHDDNDIKMRIDSETYWIEMSGWILFEDKKFIILSTKRSRDGLWGNIYKIPKAWVIKKKVIKL